MGIVKISKDDFIAFIGEKLKDKDTKTIGAVRKGSHYVFDQLHSAKELCLDYDVTLLPLKNTFNLPGKRF
jgi:hypothetical protein